MKWLPYIELMSRRPTALKYTTFYEELPDNWRKHLNGLASEDKRKALHALHTMLQKHDMGTASDALLAALSKGVQDADSILASYRLLTATSHQCQPLKLPAAVIQMPNFKTDNAKYDSLFGREAIL